jgi:uncharacterized protein (DUF885 family)
MVAIRRTALKAVLALAVVAVAACGPRRPEPMSAFEGRLLDWTTEILRDDPELAALAGVSDAQAGGAYANRLTDRSPLAAEARRTAAIRRNAELMSIDADRLSASERLTYDIIAARFAMISEGAAFPYGDLRPLDGVRPYVLNQLDSAFINLPSFFAERHQIESSADAENYIARLDAVADALDGETARARTDAAAGIRPPRFIMDATLVQLENVLSLPPLAQPYITDLRAKLDARAASISDAAGRAALERENLAFVARAEAIVRGEIIPAHQRAAQFLIAERSNAADEASVQRLPQGRDFYAAALAIETTTTLTPDEIHTIGLNRITALNRELDIALRRVGLTAGSVGERLAQVTADPRHRYEDSDEGRAQLIRDVEARVARMMERAPQYFGRMPRSPLVVRRVPLLAEASQPGAYYSPPTLDGAQPGVYYINLRNLAEMTRIDVPTQDFHEAVPGHHFQVALAQEIEDAPLLRRLTPFNAYAEGWGLYAEQLADEAGFYERDPIGRIGYLRWQLWRAARLVVDTGLHAKGWSRQQAIDYMVGVTGDAIGTISTEVDRYVVWPGQACGYELGRREIVRLREEARNELGPDFDVRGFHDAVLLNGELPLPILDQVVRDWIPEQRRLAERERRRR